MHRIIRYSWLGKGTEFPPFHFTDSFFLEMAVEMLDFRNFREREVHEAASATLESVQNLIQLLSQQQQNNEGDTNCRSDDAAVNRLKKAVYAFGNTRGHARFRKAPPGSTPPSLVPKPETEQCCNKEFNHCCDENVSCVPVNNKLYYPTTTITTPLPPPPPLPQTFIHNNAMTFSEHTFAQNNNPSFPSQALQINNKTDYNSSSGFKVWKEPVTSLSSPNSSLTASGLDPCEAASLLVKSLPAPAPVPSRPPWSSSSSSPKKSCTHGKSDDISGKCGTPGRCHCSKRKKSRVKRTLRVPAISLKMADIPSDEFSWRKYGQKPIKGSPHPRGYYKCSTVRGCPARKHVERAPDDPNVLIVTYEGEHYHSHSHSHTMSENTGLVVDP